MLTVHQSGYQLLTIDLFFVIEVSDGQFVLAHSWLRTHVRTGFPSNWDKHDENCFRIAKIQAQHGLNLGTNRNTELVMFSIPINPIIMLLGVNHFEPDSYSTKLGGWRSEAGVACHVMLDVFGSLCASLTDSFPDPTVDSRHSWFLSCWGWWMKHQVEQYPHHPGHLCLPFPYTCAETSNACIARAPKVKQNGETIRKILAVLPSTSPRLENGQQKNGSPQKLLYWIRLP